MGKELLDQTPKAQRNGISPDLREKETKMLANYRSDKELISRIYKELK